MHVDRKLADVKAYFSDLVYSTRPTEVSNPVNQARPLSSGQVVCLIGLGQSDRTKMRRRADILQAAQGAFLTPCHDCWRSQSTKSHLTTRAKMQAAKHGARRPSNLLL